VIWQAVVVVGVSGVAMAWFMLVPSEFRLPVDDGASADEVRQQDDFALWERQFSGIHLVNPRAWADFIDIRDPDGES